MAQTKLASTKITVFPSSARTDSPSARMVSEFGLTSIVNRFTDNKNFVLGDFTNNILEFNILGYYFKCDLSDVISTFSSGTDIYAVIKITKTVSTNAENYWQRLAPVDSSQDMDSNSEFNGLYLTDDISGVTSDFTYLKLLTKEAGNWVIPDDSKLLLDFSINDGVIGE